MKELIGNTQSLNKHTLEEIRQLYDYIVGRNDILSTELVNAMSELTLKINREIAVYLDRAGKVELVSIGSSDLAKLPELWKKRSAEGLSGLRCIHTHPSGDSTLSSPDLSALISLHLDCIIAIGAREVKPKVSMATIMPEEGVVGTKCALYKEMSAGQMMEINFRELILSIEQELRDVIYDLEVKEEKTVLVLVANSNVSDEELEERIDELKELSKTAGLGVEEVLVQRKDRPDSAYYLGKGKLEELSLICQNKRVNCVIFEQPLSPSQQSNLTELLGLKVLDRTNLILDIFAQRAKSKEGKLQVELAQLNYLLPRLVGKGIEMSRLGGGVGTRGPGETKLESDKRHIRRRIQIVERELEEVKKHRATQQSAKTKNKISEVALIGYTNAGKSSLLNLLTNEQVLAEDKLFATLDTTTRSFALTNKQKALITDTVGFIRDLPHQLVSAFKATLDQLHSADLLLHVIDLSNPNYENHIKTVHQVLRELKAEDKEMIYVFNKIDRLEEIPPVNSVNLRGEHCFISVREDRGIEQLIELIRTKLLKDVVTVTVDLPFSHSHMLNKCYKIGEVDNLEYHEQGMTFVLTTDRMNINTELEQYITME